MKQNPTPKFLAIAGLMTALQLQAARPAHGKNEAPAGAVSALVQPRQPDGKGAVTLSGELKQWHQITLTLDGPFAAELDNDPNPYTDSNLMVNFTHESGSPSYIVPGYFAADGNAAETSATAGTKWRAHLSPDKVGKWNYYVAFTQGKGAALDGGGTITLPGDGQRGSFSVADTDKTGRYFRGRRRLQYVGKHHLQFAGNKQYFLKAGADAPETFLAYVDFDGTIANKSKVPLKTWATHVKDWMPGSPTWKSGKGSGIVGALDWNFGEENTQTKDQQLAGMAYVAKLDPYSHLRVIHTYPNQQDKICKPLVGDQSMLTGASLQNEWNQTHQRTLKCVMESAEAGKPWVLANDEQGSAATGIPADPGYEGFSGVAKENDGAGYMLHDTRKLTLWGNLMAGGAGVEYYFGYKLPQNDLLCQDYRSRDQSWDFARIAVEFFHANNIPFWEMKNADVLVGNPGNENNRYCLAQAGKIYLVYLPQGGSTDLELTGASGGFTVKWFNPRSGGALRNGSVKIVRGGGRVVLGNPPSEPDQDWVIIVR